MIANFEGCQLDPEPKPDNESNCLDGPRIIWSYLIVRILYRAAYICYGEGVHLVIPFCIDTLLHRAQSRHFRIFFLLTLLPCTQFWSM